MEEFGVDGVYLDNGFEWPELFRINEDEMLRRDTEDNSQIYSDQQILEG